MTTFEGVRNWFVHHSACIAGFNIRRFATRCIFKSISKTNLFRRHRIWTCKHSYLCEIKTVVKISLPNNVRRSQVCRKQTFEEYLFKNTYLRILIEGQITNFFHVCEVKLTPCSV